MWPFKQKKSAPSKTSKVLSGKLKNLQDSFKSQAKELTDLKLAIQREDPEGDPVNETVKKGRRQTQPVIFYQLPGRTGNASRNYSGFGEEAVPEIGPTYDLSEVIRLQDIESYYAVSVDRHVELIMKDGFYLHGTNPETKAYVERRLKEISYISGQPFSDTVRELVRNTVGTSNGFMVKKRDRTRSSGRMIRMFNKELEPISGIYIPDPSSITVKQNKSGRPYTWIQRIEENEKRWPYTDVIHIPIRKKSGFLFGTPYVIPVLEDIRALRKLEQLQEHVSHKYAFPLMHWIVGTEEHPADMFSGPNQETYSEITLAENYAKMLAQEGFVVTAERNEIKILGAEGERLDLQPFIDHMELRVLSGLRISELDIGRGDTSNRSTAKVMSQILVDACKEIQDSISLYLNQYLIDELLLEGGYDPFSEDVQVKFCWPSIDKEEERASENHHLNQYVTGGITQSELRTALGRNPLSPEDEKELFLYRWLIPLAEASAEAKAAAKPSPTSKNSAKKMKTMTQPTNQMGTLGTVPKVTANDAVLAHWDDCRQAVVNAMDKKVSCKTATTIVSNAIANTVLPKIKEVWTASFLDHSELKGERKAPSDDSAVNTYLSNMLNTSLRSLVKTCMITAGINADGGYKDSCSVPKVSATWEAMKPLLLMRVDRFIRGAKFLGEMDAERQLGRSKAKLTMDSGKTQEIELDGDGWVYLAADPKLTAVTSTDV